MVMNMNDRIKKAFNQVWADEDLKNKTKAYLAQKTRGYARAARRSPWLYAAAVCACLLFLLIGVPLLYFTPTSVISIDINPSLELNVNRFDRVISVNALNADGQNLAAAFNLKNRNYRNALELILENQNVIALLAGDEILAITVTGSDETQSVRIFSDLESYTAEHSNIHCYHTSTAEVAGAHESGLSCGKYRAYLELKNLDPDITPEAVQNMTMREIQDLIYSLSGNTQSETSPGNPADNEHGHHGSEDHKNSTGHRKRHGAGR